MLGKLFVAGPEWFVEYTPQLNSLDQLQEGERSILITLMQLAISLRVLRPFQKIVSPSYQRNHGTEHGQDNLARRILPKTKRKER